MICRNTQTRVSVLGPHARQCLLEICAAQTVNQVKTYSDVTSRGKLRGIISALWHSALSLVHVQCVGQRGCLGFPTTTASKTHPTTSETSQGDLTGIFGRLSMLAKQKSCTRTGRVRRGSFSVRPPPPPLQARRRAVRSYLYLHHDTNQSPSTTAAAFPVTL